MFLFSSLFSYDRRRNYTESINPYEILGISESASHEETKYAFKKLITSFNRRARSEACLAYDILSNRNKYIKEGSYYRVKKKDCFYYVVIGDTDSLKRCIENNRSLLYAKDDLKRNLLYLAARNGYYDICEFLIKKGIDVNSTQKDGSTPLHGAAFYGHKIIVQLLISYGAKINIKNNFGNLASEEASESKLAEEIKKSSEDKILKLYQKLFSKGLVKNLILIKKKMK